MVAALPTYTMQTTLLPRYFCNSLERKNRDFIWGAHEGTRKCHTIGWNTFCQSRKQGGMGFRDLYDFSQALMMKLGWGLVAKPEAL